MKNKAITLVELLVSIGILAVTISLVAVFIKYQQPRFALAAATHDLQTALNQARGRALSAQREHRVRFIIPANQYELIDGAAVLSTRTLPATTQFYSVGPFTDNTISFNPAGGASQSGLIIIQNSQGQSQTITIAPAGFIRVN